MLYFYLNNDPRVTPDWRFSLILDLWKRTDGRIAASMFQYTLTDVAQFMSKYRPTEIHSVHKQKGPKSIFLTQNEAIVAGNDIGCDMGSLTSRRQ